MVWAVKHYRDYLYGHEVQIITDHSAVKDLLSNPSPSGKHARWWLQVYGSGLRKIEIIYRPGKENGRADALSRNLTETSTLDLQVATVSSRETAISNILQNLPGIRDGLPEQWLLKPYTSPWWTMSSTTWTEGGGTSASSSTSTYTAVDFRRWPCRENGRTFLRCSPVRYIQSSVVVAHNVQGCAGVL